jgi:hypothetical protein
MKTKIQKINIQKIQTAALLTIATLGLASPAFAQNVSISPTGNAPDNSAALDIRDYTDKGVLIPRIALTGTTSAGPISNPANSLLVYNTTNNPAAGLTPGYYYNAGTTTSPIWVRLLNGGTPSDAWLTLGNAGTNSGLNFIGTTDNRSLRFRTNNVHRMVIDSVGNVGIGTKNPSDILHIAGGDARIGEINPLNTGSFPGYGRYLYFSGGPAGNTWDSDNSDLLWIARYNVASDQTELRVNIGDNCQSEDAFVVGTIGSFCSPSGPRWDIFRVQANGNVGIGTTAPLDNLHIAGYQNRSIIMGETGGNFPEYNSYIGFGARVDNSAGDIKKIAYNGTGGGLISVDDNGNMRIRTFNTATTSEVSVGNPVSVYIANSGNVGIGTTAPSTRLHVAGGDIEESDGTSGFIMHSRVGFGYDFWQLAPKTAGNYEWGKGITLVRSTGNVGIGTTAPADKLEVSGGAVRFGGGNYKNGSVETGRIFIDNSQTISGFSNDAWVFEKSDANDLDPDSPIAFVTVGSDNVVKPRLVIQGSGNVGIGTTTPNERLSVVGNICATGNITANSATCGSDIRWKKDLKPLENTLEKISQLKPVYYYWKKDEFPDKHFTDKRQIGLIAQDMQKVFPELVVEDKDGYLSVDYSRFTSVLLKAIQEQQQIIQDQQKIIQELQAENAQTKSEVKALAEKMNILINTLSAEKKVGNK